MHAPWGFPQYLWGLSYLLSKQINVWFVWGILNCNMSFCDGTPNWLCSSYDDSLPLRWIINLQLAFRLVRFFSLHGGLFTETMFASELSISYCLQTIAIIPVLPRGVLQLGSTSVVRYPCFSNWDYYIVYIVLHVLKLFSVIIIWPWCTTLWLCYIVDWSNVCSLDLCI